MQMEDHEMLDIPRYFICPISLEIMKDPVTAVTGITYDRDNIEHWLSTAEDVQCPVTKQPLPKDSDLTPNHTLRRLIQAWCVANADYGIDRIPTPKPLLTKTHVTKLLRNLKSPELCIVSLNSLHLIANESEKSRKCLIEADTTGAMISLMIKLSKESRTSNNMICLGQALAILLLSWPEKKHISKFKEEHEFIDSLLSVLGFDSTIEDDLIVDIQTRAMIVLGMVLKVSDASVLERLKLDFFKQTVDVLRKRKSPQKAINATLRMLIDMCPWGRNRMKIVEAGAVFELVELEINGLEKNVTELVFGLLAQLCSCAEGRAQLIKHACGIAVVAKRMFRVSPATDDRAVHILSLIGRFSATDDVVAEMMRAGAVSKLCMVLQVNYASCLKKKAREILKLHSNVWNTFPCMPIILFS